MSSKDRSRTIPTPKKASPSLPELVVAEQLTRSMGNVSHAARALGMNRAALHERISRTPALRQVVTDARESIVDAAESALYGAVVKQAGWAVCFTLKTLGKSRGYVERVELVHDPIEWTQVPDELLNDYVTGRITEDDVRRILLARTRAPGAGAA